MAVGGTRSAFKEGNGILYLVDIEIVAKLVVAEFIVIFINSVHYRRVAHGIILDGCSWLYVGNVIQCDIGVVELGIFMLIGILL